MSANAPRASATSRPSLLAVGLPELLQLVLVAPWWRDSNAFTSEQLKTEYLADTPNLEAGRDRVAELLGLALPPEEPS